MGLGHLSVLGLPLLTTLHALHAGPGASSAPACTPVWTGDVKAAAFGRFQEHQVKSAAEARKLLEGRGVAHYWDLAVAAVADAG